jgi:hypothetical protein
VGLVLLLLYRRIRYGYPFRRISLTKGKYAIVDLDDYDRLSAYKWHVGGRPGAWYARRSGRCPKTRRTIVILMHRQIMNPPNDLLIDHINFNGLDNRRRNLRIATHSQNTCHRRKLPNSSQSKYKGLYRTNKDKPWAATIGYNRKQIYLGHFEDEKQAARAYDKAAREYHKEFAVLNFPEDANQPPPRGRQTAHRTKRLNWAKWAAICTGPHSATPAALNLIWRLIFGTIRLNMKMTAAIKTAFLFSVFLLTLSPFVPAADYDLTADGAVDWPDVSAFSAQWLVTPCPPPSRCEGADFDHSGIVELGDFALLARNWRQVYEYITTYLAGHEPDETHVEIRGPRSADPSLTIGYSLPGGAFYRGFGDVPPATEGSHVLGLVWTNEADRKVEYGYRFAPPVTFDLDGQDEIAFDVFVPANEPFPGPDDIGIYDGDFGWRVSANEPEEPNRWSTVVVDVARATHQGLDEIDAVVFAKMGDANDTAGRVFVDNMRLRRINPDYYSLTAVGHDSRIDLEWQPLSAPSLRGYNIYRSESADGPFAKLNDSPYKFAVYSDFLGPADRNTYHYYISSELKSTETAKSGIVAAAAKAMTDDELLSSVQEATFRYFYDFAHPDSGMAREGLKHGRGLVTTGGTGFGLMALVVGSERGFVTREAAAERTLKILTFLDEKASRYHGAWAHWLNGKTGKTVPFSTYDDGADLVETAFLVQGMLTARQYFDSADPTESRIRTLATEMWHDVEWDWFARGGKSLYWHWSPNHEWQINLRITGFNECMIAYILAIASPTHPIAASCYNEGWARLSSYTNGNTYYGHKLDVGRPYGGPLFWTHYSFLGFDPRNKSDDYCNYFENSRATSLINRAHCIANPNGFEGYSELVWGLTACVNPSGYSAHSPTNDNGTIAPTAAISAMPYVPAESLATLKHLYRTYGHKIWGPFGFYDSFNVQQDWYSDTYLAIDQGPILIMIENHRTALLWEKFMANPEIIPALRAIGWTLPRQ